MSKYCGNCGNQVDERAYVCPKCGVIVNNNFNDVNNRNINNVVDNGGIGYAFLGFFFPVVGLILYLVWKDNKPKSAKSVGKGALISVIVGVIFYVLLMILFGVVFCIMSSNM